MAIEIRKKSPRAPSIGLGDAVEKATRVYEKERRHPAPPHVVAQHLGYKDANNGAALTTLAGLGYYGLVDRTKEGLIVVTKDLETYLFAPSEETKKEIAARWLKTPAVFAELIDKYGTALPSDGTLKFDFIQRGFIPQKADSCVSALRKSVEFAKFYESPAPSYAIVEEEEARTEEKEDEEPLALPPQPQPTALNVHTSAITADKPAGTDRIPVRLSGGRRAWIEVPTPFFSADKERLKAQIDLLLADDEDGFE